MQSDLILRLSFRLVVDKENSIFIMRRFPISDAEHIASRRILMSVSSPVVGIIMGSQSDWKVMKNAADRLESLGIAHECKIISAHRTPERLDEYARSAGAYKLHADNLADVKSEMIIMHPLPRVDEIHASVDSTRHACYFNQAFNGVVARMALICYLLGVTVPMDVESEGGAL